MKIIIEFLRYLFAIRGAGAEALRSLCFFFYELMVSGFHDSLSFCVGI